MDGAGEILVKFLRLVIWHDFAFEPEAASIMYFSPVLCDVTCPPLAVEIVFPKVLVGDSEEDVIIHPFGQRADAM